MTKRKKQYDGAFCLFEGLSRKFFLRWSRNTYVKRLCRNKKIHHESSNTINCFSSLPNIMQVSKRPQRVTKKGTTHKPKMWKNGLNTLSQVVRRDERGPERPTMKRNKSNMMTLFGFHSSTAPLIRYWCYGDWNIMS